MKKMTKKISALILAFVMTVGVIPTYVMADTEVVNVQETETNVTPSLELGKEYTITIAEDGAKEIWYQFNPVESGCYTVYSEGDYDSYCELYDSNMVELERNDDSNGSSNFSLQYEFTAGNTYYYKFRMFSETFFGNYIVKLVKNVPAASINIGYNTYTAYVGSKLYLRADFEPEFAYIEEVSWTSSNEKVASVSEYGDVQMLSEGTAVITATSESGLIATCTLTVKPAMDAVLDTTYTITTDGESITDAMYKFVPEKSGYYRFYSFNGECDTDGRLYDEYFNELKYDDQSGEANHFAIDYELEAGKIYYINVSPYNKEKASFDFRIREITPTLIKDAYFTVDNEKKEEFGFSVTEANEVTLWIELSKGDDIEILDIHWSGECINQDFAVESTTFTAEYNQDMNLYYTKIPSSYFKDGCEFYVNEISLVGTDDDIKYLNNINGESIDNIYYLMGEGVVNKTYDVHFSVADDSSVVSVTTSRITSLSEMGIEIPTVPVFEGAEFLGWELTINGLTTDIIKSNDEKFTVNDLFDKENGLTDITLTAVYDKNIVIGYFYYINKDGEDAEISIETAVNKNSNTTIEQWLESVVSGDLLVDIEHTSNMIFEGWDALYYDPDYVIDFTYGTIEVEADYSFDGIVLGGVHINDGDYLNNAGEVSKTVPEGGYAYYSDEKLTLHNYIYKGDGNTPIGKNCALYARSNLEIVLEGTNRLNCISGDVIYNEQGNLTISGDGYIDIKTNGGYDGIDLVDGDLTIESGVLNIESGDHGCEIDGAITIDGGIIKIKAGDDGMDFDYDFVINDGIVDIDTEDIGLDSSENIFVKGGFIRVKTEDDEGFEAGNSIVIEDGNIIIDSNGPGLCAWGKIEINGGYAQINSNDNAIISESEIIFGDKMESYETIKLDEYLIAIGVNGETVKEAVLKEKEATKLSYINESWVSLAEEEIAYTGEVYKPAITIADGENVLVEGTDYTVSYTPSEIREVGDYLLIINGVGSYTGTIIKKVTVYEDIIFVGNTWMENGDYLAVGATETVKEEPETDGYAYYKDGVLELNNYQYIGSGYEYDTEGYCSVIYSDNSFSIELVGENAIINDNPDGEGITAYGSIKLNGNGSVYIEAVYGIGNYDGDIVMDGGNVDITAKSGIWCEESDIYINGGILNINAERGVTSYNALMFNGGVVKINSTDFSVKAYKIDLKEDMNIIKPENGTIKAVDGFEYIFEGDDYAYDVIIMSIEGITKLIEGKTIDNVTSDDKKNIQNVVELIDELLTEEGWSDEEKNFLENTKTDAVSLIEKIDTVADALITNNIQEVEDINADNVIPEDKDVLEAAKADLEKALEENSGNYTASEKQEIKDKIDKINKLLEVLANTVFIYFDNSETNWECVFACYEDKNGEINIIGSVKPDENGICTVSVPVDCKIQFWNFLPGQPPEEAPEEGFLQTDFMEVEEGKTYKYEPSQSNILLGDTNLDTKITAQDALLVLKHAAKLSVLVGDTLTAADVTFDGNVNASDALEILKYAANIIDSFEKK